MADIAEFLKRTARPGTTVSGRLWTAMAGQGSATPVCPDTPRLDGKRALVTGGNAGIGFWISHGLAARGADVMIAARREALLRDAAARMSAETGKPVQPLVLDLADLRSVDAAMGPLAQAAATGPFEVVVLNAGVWPKKYATSAQGHEIAFAVNALGHHVLVKRMLAAGLLAPRARVVVLTGDIYIMERACTPDFRYGSAYGGMLAYCRSKLGNVWFARELARRHPSLEVVVVHPGVVASGLVSGEAGVVSSMNRLMLISPQKGAQTPLVGATQPGLAGLYLHNTAGQMQLPPDDPAVDAAAAARFWDTLESLDRH